MAANVQPVFPETPKAVWATFTTANTAKDGTGATSLLATAGADAAYVEDLRAMPLGTNIASVLRLFLNNGASPAVAANNTLWYEVALPASTLDEDGAQTAVVILLNRAIPAGYRLYACIGTAVAAGWQVTVTAGDY